MSFIVREYQPQHQKPLPRLIKRNLPFHQSRNNVNVANKYGQHKYIKRTILQYDWFHVFLRLPTYLSLFICLIIWTCIIVVFAFVYMALDDVDTKPECTFGLKEGEAIDFTGAFAFSLETCTTVGYGLPAGSAFFEHCYGLQIAIYAQMALSLLFNAFLITFFYGRISRCEARATQLLFSEKAIIHMDEDGKLVLEVQVYDADARYPVVEAHARLYVVHPASRSDCEELRVVRPNDEFNTMLLTSVPSRVAHHIDIYSPLMPSKFRHRENIVPSYGLNLREVDSYIGNRTGFMCPACGESYGTLQHLWVHIRYNQLIEPYGDMPNIPDTHIALGKEEDYKQDHKIPTYTDLQHFFNNNQMEVVAVVEGIDPLASGTFQALQSYQKEDIVFSASFAKCFTDDNIVDFDLFHSVVMDSKHKHKLTRQWSTMNHCTTPLQHKLDQPRMTMAPKIPMTEEEEEDDCSTIPPFVAESMEDNLYGNGTSSELQEQNQDKDILPVTSNGPFKHQKDKHGNEAKDIPNANNYLIAESTNVHTLL